MGKQYKIERIRLRAEEAEQQLGHKAAEALGVEADAIKSIRVLRRSVDARRGQVVFEYSLAVELQGNRSPKGKVEVWEEPVYQIPPRGERPLNTRPVVVGAGPAGLFAAWVLAQAGYCPIILERGADVLTRKQDIKKFWQGGELNERSNVQFGEGGAGAFSDGKLMSRVKDPRCAEVLRVMVEMGAPPEIQWLAKPHVGSDKLLDVVLGMRKTIQALGGSYRFLCRMESLDIKDREIEALLLEDGERLPAQAAILAVGNSARDTFAMAHRIGLAMEQKPFAVGMRIEHRRETIDRLQYGKSELAGLLGAADYHLTAKVGHRNAYTFCMCPGGLVINASSQHGLMTVNGMSLYQRNAENSNAAVVVSVDGRDFGEGALAGMEFQNMLERRTYLEGDGGSISQRVEDFLSRRASARFGEVSPSIRPVSLPGNAGGCLPNNLEETLRSAVKALGERMPGFAHPDALLTAVESRTSSPVRMLRAENMLAQGIDGLYPAGEGAGYAGGIMSAAIDGMRAAENLIGQWRYVGNGTD